MERRFTNENFERFLQQNAEGLRMRPSDKVWKGISRRMNRSRRTFGFILSISLLTISTWAYYWMDHSPKAGTTASSNAGSSKTVDIGPSKLSNTNSDSKMLTAVSGSKHNQKDVFPIASAQAGELVNTFNPDYNDVLSELHGFTPTIVDSYDFNTNDKKLIPPSVQHINATDPLMTESVVTSHIAKAKKGKVGWQVYFTPTVSYRKLSENKSYKQSMAASNAYPDNVNSMVTHKPDFGFEIGFAAKYPISTNVKVRGGLQFNINRYDIRAFSSSTQQTAMIRLNDRNAVGQQNTIPIQTNYNNFTGYKTDWLENFYFQVSAPVGFEVKLRGDDKMSLGVATTIQPTYVLGDRAYLISTDYKNYVEVPSLIRRWNLNTNFETFVAYSTGHLKWQVGPQVRYQLFSSFVKKYPVKENLFDFGLKVGISLNNQ